MNRRATLLFLVALAGVAIGLSAEHYSRHTPENHWLDLAVGWTYIGAGLIAVARRPGNRIGPLMLAFGFSWFIGNFGNAPVPLLLSLGVGFQAISSGFLAHLVLAYPDGRLTRRPERTVVALIYGWLLAQSMVYLLSFDPARFPDCSHCRSAPLAMFPSRAAVDAADTGGNVAAAVFAILVLALVLQRFLRSSTFARRELTPLWIGAALIAASFVLEGVHGAAFSQQDPAQQLLIDLQKVAELLVPLAFLAGLLRSRLAESSIARLVVELSGPLRPGDLRSHLARALADPSLQLAYSVPGGGSFVDDDGRAVALPRGDAERATTFVANGSRPIAALIHDRALRERQPLVDAVGAAARLALENERLHAEVRAQLEEVRASRARIVEAADAERKRVERNLHDGAQQRLVTLSLELALAREQAANGASAELRASLEEAADEVAQALTELRELGRGLHPSILTEAGLGAALEALAERAALPTYVTSDLAQPLPPSVEAAAYFVAAEALANAGKHARASRIDLNAHIEHDQLVLLIRDDGIGGACATDGSGLAGLADRVAALGGKLSIESNPGHGTQLRAEFPCG
ncbi:MAG: histidine kinase [Gaiellaceae bacterium]|jgi:signal transduction histidine kinase